ncbi:MAG: HDIG domain-containing protein [Saprospiraceae bacterium]|nr:HDIG domain-containing protein [Saprospiraceae bacterium]
MSLQILKNTFTSPPKVVRFFLLAALVLFLSIFFPTNLEFDYDFEQGKRWAHADLQAPFDFPIKKNAEELANERAVIEKHLIPYFSWDKGIITFQQEQFISKFNQKLVALNSLDSVSGIDSMVYINTGLKLLNHIYDKRLIDFPVDLEFHEDSIVFELLDGNIGLGEYSSNDVMTQKIAIQYVVDELYSVRDQLTNSKFLLEILETILEVPNITFDSIVTNKSRTEAFNNISPYRGMVKAGDPIVSRNRIIDLETYDKLISYKTKYNQEINQNKNSLLIYFAYLAITIALIGIFTFFVQFYSPEVFANVRHFSLIIMMIAGFSYFAYVVNGIYVLDLYMIPFCIIPIIIINFFSAQLALFTHVVIILLVSMLLALDYQFILIHILIGMVAVVTKMKTRYLSDFFISLLYIGIAYTAGFLSLELIHTGSIFPVISVNGTVIEEGVRWYMLGWILCNVFLTLLSYPLIPLFEKFFGLTSDITLVEFADLDHPLLKQLSIEAPGTLQHSLQVANLCEAAVKAIGGNALLVKAAAYYHDIGKLVNPKYFIENQEQDSPHENLTNIESAKMIISHVSEGYKMAKKYRLPSVLTDFITTHHGTTRVEYFYRTYQQNNPDMDIDPLDFTYPGPRPKTKEQAVMMIADSLEAASKSLKSPSEEDINTLVENIIDGKIALGQLNDSNLTFRELETIKVVLKKLLKSINHIRIDYPDDDTPKPQDEI